MVEANSENSIASVGVEPYVPNINAPPTKEQRDLIEQSLKQMAERYISEMPNMGSVMKTQPLITFQRTSKTTSVTLRARSTKSTTRRYFRNLRICAPKVSNTKRRCLSA